MAKHRWPAKLGIYAGLTVFTVWTLFPVFIMVATSLGPNLAPLSSASPLLSSVSLQNYANVWRSTQLPDYFRNTVVVSVTATALSVAFSVPAAYALARFRFRGNALLSRGILSVRFVPAMVFVVPFFVMFASLRLLNTQAALIIVYTTFLLPFSIWLLTSFIRELPAEAEEAAQVDGLSRWQVVYKVLLPQIGPAIGVVAMLNLVAAWNEFLFALTLAGTGAATLPVGVVSFIGQRGVEWGQICAAAVITMLVPVAVSIAINRYLLRGLTLGATR